MKLIIHFHLEQCIQLAFTVSPHHW